MTSVQASDAGGVRTDTTGSTTTTVCTCQGLYEALTSTERAPVMRSTRGYGALVITATRGHWSVALRSSGSDACRRVK